MMQGDFLVVHSDFRALGVWCICAWRLLGACSLTLFLSEVLLGSVLWRGSDFMLLGKGINVLIIHFDDDDLWFSSLQTEEKAHSEVRRFPFLCHPKAQTVKDPLLFLSNDSFCLYFYYYYKISDLYHNNHIWLYT